MTIGTSFTDKKEAVEYAETLVNQGHNAKVTHFPTTNTYRVTIVHDTPDLETEGEGDEFTSLEKSLEGAKPKVIWGKGEKKWEELEKKRKEKEVPRHIRGEIRELPESKQAAARSLATFQKKELKVRKGKMESAASEISQFSERVLGTASEKIASRASMRKVIPTVGGEKHGYLARIGKTGAPRITEGVGESVPRIAGGGISRIARISSGGIATEARKPKIVTTPGTPKISVPVPLKRFQTPYIKGKKEKEMEE